MISFLSHFLKLLASQVVVMNKVDKQGDGALTFNLISTHISVIKVSLSHLTVMSGLLGSWNNSHHHL